MGLLDMVAKILPKALDCYKDQDDIELMLPINYLAFYKYKKNEIIDQLSKIISHLCMSMSKISYQVDSEYVYITSFPEDLYNNSIKNNLCINKKELEINISTELGGNLIDNLYKLMKINLPGNNHKCLDDLRYPILLGVDKRAYLLKKSIKLPKIDLRNIGFDNASYYRIILKFADINNDIKNITNDLDGETYTPDNKTSHFMDTGNIIKYDYSSRPSHNINNIRINLTTKIISLLKTTMFVVKLMEN